MRVRIKPFVTNLHGGEYFMKQLQLRLKHSKYISLLLAFTLVMMTAMPAIPAMAAAKSGAAFTHR